MKKKINTKTLVSAYDECNKGTLLEYLKSLEARIKELENRGDAPVDKKYVDDQDATTLQDAKDYTDGKDEATNDRIDTTNTNLSTLDGRALKTPVSVSEETLVGITTGKEQEQIGIGNSLEIKNGKLDKKQPELLWNRSIVAGEEYEAETITITGKVLTDYNFFVVVCSFETTYDTNGNRQIIIFNTEHSVKQVCIADFDNFQSSFYVRSRDIEIRTNTNSIYYDDGKEGVTSSGQLTINNKVMVPMKLYGIK